MGGTSDPIELVIDEIFAGKYSWDDVGRALSFWHQNLATGVRLPNGGMATITARDVCHYIDGDPRILRKPERMEQLLNGIVEIRTAHSGRRLALSTWYEADGTRFG